MGDLKASELCLLIRALADEISRMSLSGYFDEYDLLIERAERIVTLANAAKEAA